MSHTALTSGAEPTNGVTPMSTRKLEILLAANAVGFALLATLALAALLMH
jgi:hypothetical protein